MEHTQNPESPQSNPGDSSHASNETAKTLPLKQVITLTSVNSKDGAKPVFRLHKERLVLGSVVSADVKLSGEGVAPLHAVLELVPGSDGHATIYDLASDTGVFVNGQRVVTQLIKAGDKIRCGSQELQFNVDDVEELSLKERTRETEGRKLFLDSNEDLAPLLLEEERHVSQIFDYRPAQKRALEVVMSWHGTVLDVEHFVKEKSITVGTGRKSDFGIPPLLGEARYAIVTRSGAEFTLNIEPQMRGVLQRKGKLSSLDELRSGAGTTRIALGEEDFAKVCVGEVDFYLSFTSAPPRLKMSRLMERDPLFMKVLASSAILSAAVVATLISTYQPRPIEAEEIPERLATILYQPEKYVEKKTVVLEQVKNQEPPETPPAKKAVAPKPEPKKVVKIEITPKNHNAKPVPKEFNAAAHASKKTPPKIVKTSGGDSRHQSEAKEGEGAKAKGTEGSRGSKVAKTGPQHQSEALRTSANGGQGKGGGQSQVEDVGNVDILKAATGKIQDILGNTAAKLGKGGEKLKGFGGFTTQGSGGLALSGNGSGGGGDAASLGGMGKKGTGGGLVGTGKGATGSGNGIIGGKARVAIRSGGPEEAVVMGAIDADAVEAALLAHRDEFRLCYEKEINAETPNLAGRVGTTFVIGSTGRVNQAGIESSSLKSASAERCILNVIRRINFPIPRGAGIVQVSYPFKFNPVGNK